MAQTLKFKRGNNANLTSLTLEAGEPAFVLDTGKFYIGDGTNKILINPDLTNAETATKLQNSRIIGISGDGSGTANFDGSTDATITLVLAGTGVSAGTYTKVTVDTKGRITSATNLSASDIPTLTLSKISDAGTAASKNTGTASGNVPILDSNGKLDSSVLPAIAITDTFVVSSQSAMLALTAEVGDIAVRTDLNKSFILKTAGASTLTNWQELLTPTDSVTSVAGKTGAVTLTASDVNLGNVPNLSTNNQTPTYTDAATLTALSSGETLSTAFGKISKAISSLISHLADAVSHITSTERTNWNTAYTNNHTHSNKSILDATTASYTTAEQTKLSGIATGANNYSLPVATSSVLGGVKSGTDITIDASGNVSVNDDSHNHIISNVDNLQATLDAKTPFSTLSATTAATAGWYRIATSAINIGANSGLFKIDFSGTGVLGSVLFRASCHNGVDSGSTINQLGFSTTAVTLGLTQIRIVYHTTPTSNYAYVEAYNPTALAVTYTVDLIDSTGWSLISPSTAGSIPSGYTSESLTLNIGIVSIEDVEATRQLISRIATGTAPLIVNSTTRVTNLNVDKLDDMDASSTNTASTIVARDSSGNFSAGTVTASLSGNATTATTLQTTRTIAISGGATGTATNFNGGANIAIPITSVNASYLSGTIDGGTF